MAVSGEIRDDADGVYKETTNPGIEDDPLIEPL